MLEKEGIIPWLDEGQFKDVYQRLYQMSKNTLSEDEFKKLVERLSHRRNELEGRITIDSVRESLIELGLSDLLRENDIEEVRKQVNKELRKRQWKNYFTFAMILIGLVAPSSAFAGYSLRIYIVLNFPQLVGLDKTPDSSKLLELESEVKKLTANQTELENQLQNSQKEKDELKEQIQQLESQNKGLENTTNISTPTTVTNPATEITKRTSTSGKSFETLSIVYQLEGCQKSNVGTNSQTISCNLLIMSKRENVDFSLYANYAGRNSRILEADKKYLATSVKLGRNSDTRYLKDNLTKDVPIEAIIYFDNLPLEVNKIELFQIYSSLKSSYYNNDIKNVEFSNVSVSGN